MALVLMLIGGFFVVPCLSLMSTSLTANRMVDERSLEFYAADAGIEDGLWRVKYNQLPEWMLGTWGDATYNHDPYSPDPGDGLDLPDPIPNINNRNVKVSIEPIWVLEGLETPSPGQGRQPHDSLVTVGDVIDETAEGNGLYQIGILYDGSVGNLKIERVGCWLSAGFDYVEGSSNLEEPATFDYNGGTAITWDFSPAIDYDELPQQGSKRIVTFEFTPNENPQGCFSWIRTNRNDIYLSWDVDLKIYKVVSKATSVSGKYTEVTAYTTKNEFRMLGSALEGDYAAAGITLMRDHDGEPEGRRERLYRYTTAKIDDIPADTTVQKIFLYWSGWKCKPWYAWDLSEEELQALPEDKKVNKVDFQVKPAGATTWSDWVEGTANPSNCQVLPSGSPGGQSNQHGWSYSCFADITDLEIFGDDFTGNGEYRLGHWNTGAQNQNRRYGLWKWTNDHEGEVIETYTCYPLGSPRDGGKKDTGYEDEGNEDEWAYAAWSVVVVYTSPSTKGHQLYIYDEFRYCANNETMVFTIKGFLAPEDVRDDPEAARITCFVGEGDDYYPNPTYPEPDSILVNDSYLSDPPTNPQNNVWNSISNATGEAVAVDGVDIDTYTASGASGIIQPSDVEAEVKLPTGTDSWNLVYIILSFRSEITTGGFLSYIIESGG